MQRYAGKPFLRLLECYVLWAVGELMPEDNQKLLAMTPRLRDLYKRQGSWQEIIAGEMDLPADFPQHIKALWSQNKQRAENSGVELSAEDFARMFVDHNLVNH
ncbi:hypothetical protein K2Y11_14670 [bacterium]|nr:hypothetical protein [bacterium]